MLNGINGLTGTPAMVATTGNASPSSAASGATKILYGDASRAEGLMNMMNRIKQLSDGAAQAVRAGNPTLE